jgi:hypothetical protein
VLLLAGAPLAAQQRQPVAARAQAQQIQVQQQTQQQSVVKRASLQDVEKSIDARLSAEPFDLMGNTRGIYLPAVGVVLTSEVALAKLAGPSPFHQTISAGERTRAHAQKIEALPKLREAIKAALLTAATDLRTVPLNEKVIFGVTLFYWNWEDTSGLPSQIVMQATRQQLVSKLEAVQVQEF